MRAVRILDDREMQRLVQMHAFERQLWENGLNLVAGVDEAGRGPLAGPLVAAAVVLQSDLLLPGLNDSKKVRPCERQRLAVEIKKRVTAWGIGVVTVGYIERHNVLNASLQAMRSAIEHLGLVPDHLLVDGCWKIRGLSLPQTTLVKGDTRSAAIAAASILAKTTRDAIMTYYGRLFPVYGFGQNKGYPTRGHLDAISKYGPCWLHRRTFRGVKSDEEA